MVVRWNSQPLILDHLVKFGLVVSDAHVPHELADQNRQLIVELVEFVGNPKETGLLLIPVKISELRKFPATPTASLL